MNTPQLLNLIENYIDECEDSELTMFQGLLELAEKWADRAEYLLEQERIKERQHD